MSLRRHLLNLWLRHVEKPRMMRVEDPLDLRRSFERKARLLFHAPRGTHTTSDALGSGQALTVLPRDARGDGVVFYLHGGGFVFGSPDTHAPMLAQLVRRVGGRAILPRYRLAPEHPFPAAVEDVRAAWDALLATGVAPERIIIGGDSAGGALAFGLLADLCVENAPRPAAVFCFSPLTDMSFGGESFRLNARSESLLPAPRAAELRAMYLGECAYDDPRVSPLLRDFVAAPPVWLTVGTTEILRDDARRIAGKLRGAGVDVTLTEQNDLPHVWPILHNFLPEARTTLDDLAQWIRRQPGWTDGN